MKYLKWHQSSYRAFMREFLINLWWFFQFKWRHENLHISWPKETLLIKTIVLTRREWIRFLCCLFKIQMPRLIVEFLLFIMPWLMIWFTWFATHRWARMNNWTLFWKSKRGLTAVVWACLLFHYQCLAILKLFRIRLRILFPSSN